MSLSGSLARPLLAGIFISGGVDAIRDPEKLAKKADEVAPGMARAVGLPTTDTVTLVRVNGAIQVTAGTLLALGKFRRLSALALAASLVPTTYAGHRFWEETDPDERARQQKQFLKNAAMFGGLILAAGDTGGRPSLPWTARKAAHRGLDASAAVAGSLTDSGAKVGEEVAAGVAVAVTQAADLSRRAAKAAATASDSVDVADLTKRTRRATRRALKAVGKSELSRRARRAARRAVKAARKSELSKGAAQAAAKARQATIRGRDNAVSLAREVAAEVADRAPEALAIGA